MGVSTTEVGYTSATTGKGDHEVRKGHVVALEKNYSSIRGTLFWDVYRENGGSNLPGTCT
jgi:hypothetical protein